MTKKERLEALIAHYSDGKPTKFAKLLGVAPSTISSWLKRDTYDHELLFAKCESISAEWLITGEGNIFKPQINEDVNFLRDQLRRKDREIDELFDRIEELKLMRGSKKRVRTNSNIPISSEIEKFPTNKEYEEFIKFLKTNPDPSYLRGRIDIFLDEIGTDLEELSLSFGIEPKEAEQELEKNVSDISPEVLDMIKETYRERGSEVVHDTSITMNKLKRKYKAQALTIKHANEQI